MKSNQSSVSQVKSDAYSDCSANAYDSDYKNNQFVKGNLGFSESLKELAKNGKLTNCKISVKTKFDKKTTDILKNWLLKNIDHPYPSDETKDELSEITGLSKRQIQNWFTNTRKRYVQPLKRKIENSSINAKVSKEFSMAQDQSTADSSSTYSPLLNVRSNKNQENIKNEESAPQTAAFGYQQQATSPVIAPQIMNPQPNFVPAFGGPMVMGGNYYAPYHMMPFAPQFFPMQNGQAPMMSQTPMMNQAPQMQAGPAPIFYENPTNMPFRNPNMFQAAPMGMNPNNFSGVPMPIVQINPQLYQNIQNANIYRDNAQSSASINMSLQKALQMINKGEGCYNNDKEKNMLRRPELEADLHQISKRIHQQ